MAKSKEIKSFGPIVHDADVSTPGTISFPILDNNFNLRS